MDGAYVAYASSRVGQHFGPKAKQVVERRTGKRGVYSYLATLRRKVESKKKIQD